MPITVTLKFDDQGGLVSEILPCGCDYEVFSETFGRLSFLTGF